MKKAAGFKEFPRWDRARRTTRVLILAAAVSGELTRPTGAEAASPPKDRAPTPNESCVGKRGASRCNNSAADESGSSDDVGRTSAQSDAQYSEMMDSLAVFAFNCHEFGNEGLRPSRSEGEALESTVEAYNAIQDDRRQYLWRDLANSYAECGYVQDAKRLLPQAFDMDELADPASDLDEIDISQAISLLRKIGESSKAETIEHVGWQRLSRKNPIRVAEIIEEELTSSNPSGGEIHPQVVVSRVNVALEHVERAVEVDATMAERGLRICRNILRIGLKSGLPEVLDIASSKSESIVRRLEEVSRDQAVSYVNGQGPLLADQDERWGHVSFESDRLSYVAVSRGFDPEDPSGGILGKSWELLERDLQREAMDQARTDPEIDRSRKGKRTGKSGRGGRDKGRKAEAGAQESNLGTDGGTDPVSRQGGRGESSPEMDPTARRRTVNTKQDGGDERRGLTRQRDATMQLAMVAATYYELGTIAQILDRVDQAEEHYRRARELDEALYGSATAIRGLDLMAQGTIALQRQRYDDAVIHLRAAAPLLKAENNRPTSEYYAARESLAVALEAVGDSAGSLEIHEELVQDVRNLSKVEVVRRRLNHASALRTAGRFEDARAAFEWILEYSTQSFGPLHPETAAVHVHLVAVEAAAGQYEQAAKQLATMLSASNGALETMLRVGSEGDKLAFLRERWRETSIAVTLALDTRSSTPATIRTAAEFVLNRKGRVAEAVTRQIGDTGSLGESGSARLKELAALRRSIAEATLLGQESEDLVAAKSTKLRELESELSRGAPDVGVVRGISDVAARLHDGEVYVEYVRYRPMRAEMACQSERWGPPRYAAFVLHPDGTLAVHGLGAAKDIDAQVSTLRTALSKRAAYDVAARNLHQALWAPLSGDIGSAGRVYLVPDGALSLLPFEVLMDGAGEHLVKSRAFDYLATGRDLLRQSTSQPNDARLLYAAVDFGVASTRRDGLLGSVTFNPLPGTATEAAAIRDVAPETKMVTGMAATKASLVSVDSPKTLHVATHGFFVASGEGATSEGARGLDYEVPSAARKMAPPQNPLLRAGIALAGANEDPAKGVLTAMEASSLDLHGTKLVTLSACETGVGEATDGEGVQGMRRSLGIAGAETVVMSLWKVDDAATATLMGDYYSRLARGESRVDALRASALMLAAKPETSHPYYWAAFIASGDPGSLTGTWVAPSAGSDANKAGPPPHRGCGVDTDAKDGALAALLLACVGVVRRRRRSAR